MIDWLGWVQLLMELNLTKSNLQDKDGNVKYWLIGRGELTGPLPTRTHVLASLSAAPRDDTSGIGWPRECTPSKGYTQDDARPRAFPYGPGMVLTS